jgi:formyltetrahydrofolate deformylase
VFEYDSEGSAGLSAMQQSFKDQVARRFGMRFACFPADSKVRTLIAVSRQSHCLNSLLHHWSNGHLPIAITGVVSNHDDQRSLVQWYGLDYHHYPIMPGKKPEQEAKILALFEETQSDLLVLARYMQVLTAHACEQLAGRAINIHHSFLPGFKGARPYHQAYDRGVKLIGATAHYINTDLDEGPIIEQDVERVDHTMKAIELERLGQDVESVVLNRAVRWHAEHRVFENGHRTVVLKH